MLVRPALELSAGAVTFVVVFESAAVLDGLDHAQREAATWPGGPLLVLAGAGTGKTRTLVARA
jgi:DNA helicase-2/ATP-dependent DNA helicase PcrA